MKGMETVLIIKDREAKRALNDSPDKFLKGAFRAMRKIGRNRRDYIRELLLLPKSGKKYRNLPNRSSAPGEAPANQFGKLRKSATYTAYRYDYLAFGVKAYYGKFLEYGTEKIKPRPHVFTAGEDGRIEAINTIEQEVGKELL